MPKVSVIFEDNAVAVDGAGLTLASLPPHDASWRALQWDGARGHIEKQGGARQEFFTDAAIVQPFIDAHAAAAQKHIAAGVPIGHALPPDPPPPPPAPSAPSPEFAPAVPQAAAMAARPNAVIPGAKEF